MGDVSLEQSPTLAQTLHRAAEEARRLGHRRVGSEHLLLALLAEPVGPAATILAALPLSRAAVEAEIKELMPASGRAIEGEVPLTESAAGALQRATAAARHLGHGQVDTDHLLLGIARQGVGTGARVLLDAGVSAEMIRQLIERAAAEHRPQACRCGQPLQPAWRFCPLCGTARQA